MSHRERQNDYYARLDGCGECSAVRGQRCMNEGGTERIDPHISRVLGSTAHSEEALNQKLVECPTCQAAVGAPCRAKPYNTRLSRPHAARRAALAAAKSTE